MRTAGVFVLFLMACFDYPSPAPFTPSADSGGTEPDVGGDTDLLVDGSDLGLNLPCDIETLLATHCRGCHGATPTGYAPMSLMTRLDLLAPGLTNPTKTMAELSLARMTNDQSPMPPSPGDRVATADIEVYRAWLRAGAPSGDCSPAPDPFDTPTVCRSNRYWTEGDDGSILMYPGRACISCHTEVNREQGEEEAPVFLVAGTVYPDGHAPNDCNGVAESAGVSVIVTDNRDRVYTLKPNSAGNFFLKRSSSTPFEYPYRVTLTSTSGAKRAMNGSQGSGDCNSCHTEQGTQDAPGRILAP